MALNTPCELRGLIEDDQVFVQLAGHQVAKAGIPMSVYCAVEEALERAKKAKI